MLLNKCNLTLHKLSLQIHINLISGIDNESDPSQKKHPPRLATPIVNFEIYRLLTCKSTIFLKEMLNEICYIYEQL